MSELLARAFGRRSFLKGTGAVAVSLAGGLKGARAQSDQINVYNWDTYIGETTLGTFTEKTGIKVQYDLYANLEEMYAKFKEGNPGYDLIFPSDYMIETMIKVDLLEEIDHSRLQNWKHIDDAFKNPDFDPGARHNVPYFWGTVGLGYRKSRVETPTSWKVVFDSDQYSGRIALLADARLVIGLVLQYLGHPLNSTDPAHINEARDLLIEQKRHILAFAPDSGQRMLIAGDVDLAMEWNGDILKVMKEDPDLSYAVPGEGTIVWIDGICIPKGAPHPDAAYAFMDHIHDPQVNAEIARTINYATSNKTARKYISEEALKNPAIYPPEELIAKSGSLVDIGAAQKLYDRAWTEIQAA